jgi:hypothetical protein
MVSPLLRSQLVSDRIALGELSLSPRIAPTWAHREPRVIFTAVPRPSVALTRSDSWTRWAETCAVTNASIEPPVGECCR